jgi:hypothetical protein
MSLKPDLAISMPNIRRSIGTSSVRCSQGMLRFAKKWLIASRNLPNSGWSAHDLRAVDSALPRAWASQPRPTSSSSSRKPCAIPIMLSPPDISASIIA